MVLVTLNNLERLITCQPLFFLMQPLHWWLGRRTKDATLSQGQMIGACTGTVSSRPDKLWCMNCEKPGYSPIIISLRDVKRTNLALITHGIVHRKSNAIINPPHAGPTCIYACCADVEKRTTAAEFSFLDMWCCNPHSEFPNMDCWPVRQQHWLMYFALHTRGFST